MFHSCMVPSELALASHLPSGLKATPYTPSRAPVWRGAPTGWLQLFSNGGTVNGTTLTVPAGGSSVAVAFYSIPVPDPCQGIRDQLQYLSPGDFETLTEYERAAAYFRGQLKECEQKYGALP